MFSRVRHLTKTTTLIFIIVLLIPIGMLAARAFPGKYLTLTLMGDSYSAGNGTGDYYTGKTYNAGYRSMVNWGHNYQTWLNEQGIHTVMHDLAKSGAVTSTMLSDQVPYLPEDTDVVMLTAGGNDVHFSRIIIKCFTPILSTQSGCENQVLQAYKDFPAALNGTTKLFQAIQSKLRKKDARIVLVGYPLLANSDSYTIGSFDAAKRIRQFGSFASEQQAEFAREWNDNPANTVKVTFVPMIARFQGHEPDPSASSYNKWRWINEFLETGGHVVPGKDEIQYSGTADAMEAFHPNIEGHKQIAYELEDVVGTDLPYREDDVIDGRDSYNTFLVDITNYGGSVGDSIVKKAKEMIPQIKAQIDKDSQASGATPHYGLYSFQQWDSYKSILDLNSKPSDLLPEVNALSAVNTTYKQGYASMRAFEDAIYWAKYPSDDKANLKSRKAMYIFADDQPFEWDRGDWYKRLKSVYEKDAVEVWVITPTGNPDSNLKSFATQTGGGVLSFTDVEKKLAEPPVAALAPLESVYAQGTPITFDASASAAKANGATLTSYAWDFNGDGTYDKTTTTPTAEYTYTAPYSGPVSLRVTDSNDNTADTSADITVTRDGDLIDDAQDKCPDVSNPDQKDTGGDGKGDACDPIEATLDADPSQVYPDETTTLTAGGFGNGETVTFHLPAADGTSTEVSAQADEHGVATTTWEVPASQTAGDVTATITNSRMPANSTVSTTIKVLDKTAKRIVLSAPDALPGEKVTITASGFTNGEAVSLSNGTGLSYNGSADKNGTVTYEWTVPDSAPTGATTITASGRSGTGEGSLTILAPAHPTVTASPSPVVGGTTATLTATGYAEGDSVQFLVDGEKVGAAVTAGSNGTATLQWTATTPAEDRSATVTTQSRRGSGTGTLQILAPASSVVVHAEPSPLLPSESTHLAAQGFHPGDQVTFTITQGDKTYTAGPVEAAQRDANLVTAETDFTFPAGAPAGDYTVTASAIRGYGAETLTLLSPTTPTITAASPDVVAGSTATFNLAGFVPGEPVSIYHGDTLLTTAAVGDDGTGVASWTTPADSPATDVSLTAKGRAGSPTTSIRVLSQVDLQVVATPSTVETGATTTLTATGLDDGETVNFVIYPANNDGPIALEPVTTTNGAATATWTPATTVQTGEATVKATSRRGEGQTTVTVRSPLAATLQASPETLIAGETTELQAARFDPHESVTFATDDPNISSTTTANDQGVATWSWTTPADLTASRTYRVTASSSRGTSAPVNVLVQSRLQLTVTTDSASYTPGETVTVQATGFDDAESVTFTLPDNTTATVTPDNGVAQTTWAIPEDQQPGTITFTASVARGSGSAEAEVKPAATPINGGITAVPSTALQGGEVTFTTRDFPEGTQVTFTLPDGTTPTANVTNGMASVTWAVPEDQAAGTHEVKATADGGTATGSVQIRARIQPSVSTDKSAYRAGETVTVRATGFDDQEVVTFTLPDGSTRTAAATADGEATTTWEIPSTHADGSLTFIAGNARGNGSAEATVTALADPQISSNPASPVAGTKATVSVSGYHAGDTVTITLPGAEPTTTMVDSSGRADVVWNVPSEPGDVTISVSGDGGSNSAPVTIQEAFVGPVTVDRPIVAGSKDATITIRGLLPQENATLRIYRKPAEGSPSGGSRLARRALTTPTSEGTVLFEEPFTATEEGTYTTGWKPSDETEIGDLTVEVLTTRGSASTNLIAVYPSLTIQGGSVTPGKDATVLVRGLTPSTAFSLYHCSAGAAECTAIERDVTPVANDATSVTWHVPADLGSDGGTLRIVLSGDSEAAASVSADAEGFEATTPVRVVTETTPTEPAPTTTSAAPTTTTSPAPGPSPSSTSAAPTSTTVAPTTTTSAAPTTTSDKPEPSPSPTSVATTTTSVTPEPSSTTTTTTTSNKPEPAEPSSAAPTGKAPTPTTPPTPTPSAPPTTEPVPTPTATTTTSPSSTLPSSTPAHPTSTTSSTMPDVPGGPVEPGAPSSSTEESSQESTPAASSTEGAPEVGYEADLPTDMPLPSGSSDSHPSSPLAMTGANVLKVIWLALLLSAGGFLIIVVRRHRFREGDDAV